MGLLGGALRKEKWSQNSRQATQARHFVWGVMFARLAEYQQYKWEQTAAAIRFSMHKLT
jgi:hypothetical protein